MNKKIAVLITTIVGCLAIVLISFFGIIPEGGNGYIRVESITFKKSNEIGQIKQPNGNIINTFPIKVAKDNDTICLYDYIIYSPAETSNPVLIFSTDAGDDVTISSEGIIVINNKNIQNFTVKVKAKDNEKAFAELYVTNNTVEQTEFEFGDDFDWG